MEISAMESVIVMYSLLLLRTAFTLLKLSSELLLKVMSIFTFSPGFILPLLLPFLSLILWLTYLKSPLSMAFIAANASTRPVPVLLLFVLESFTLVVSNILQMSAGVRLGSFSSMRHMMPATHGVAIEVPFIEV